jgi:hypothetical protein
MKGKPGRKVGVPQPRAGAALMAAAANATSKRNRVPVD